jgi:hypothetical protein
MPLQVRVGIPVTSFRTGVLAGPVVPILVDRCVRRQLFEPHLVIMVQTAFVERLWRTVKYENIYLMDYASVPDLGVGLHAYFRFYNHERLHQSLNYRTPAEVHHV